MTASGWAIFAHGLIPGRLLGRVLPGVNTTADEAVSEGARVVVDEKVSVVDLENIYRVGSPLVRENVDNWDRWR